MNRSLCFPLCGGAALLWSFASFSLAQVTMTPLTTFGGDGWLEPGVDATWFSNTGATERCIAYSKSADILFVSSRSNDPHIRMLTPDTGTEINAASGGVEGTETLTKGIFVVNGVAVGSDGMLYACNLCSPVSDNNPFKIYRWDDPGSDPVVVFTSSTISLGRMGDTLDVIGGSDKTVIVAGESNSQGAGARNGYAVFTPPVTAGDFDGTLVGFTGSPTTAAGDFRAGITFTDENSVIGSQGSGGFKFTRFAGATGTFVQAKTLTNVSERPMDYIVLGGKPLLATIEVNGNTTTPPATFSTVRVYDLTSPSTPVLAASGRAAPTYYSQGASGLGTGSVQWGKVTGNSATLYALSTNNGIQAFTVTVAGAPLPPTVATQPVSRTFFERGVATFSVAPSGTPPFTYQWFHGNDPIQNATSPTLTFRPVTQASAGNYTCRITGAVAPPAMSDPAVLTVAASVNTNGLTEAWLLEPGSRPYLPTDDTVRGVGYSVVKNRLYVPRRNPLPAINVLDAANGADIGTMDVTGVATGLFTLNMIAVAEDGLIYAGNLSGAGADYRIYQWADDAPASPPGKLFDSADAGNAIGSRVGDSLAVRGAAATTLLATGLQATNQFLLFKPDGAGLLTKYTVTVPDAANGAFYQSIAFGQGNTVWGKTNGGTLVMASFEVDESGNPTGSGALVATIPVASVPGAGSAIAVDSTNGFLAFIHNGNSDNVRLYDLPLPFPNPAPAALTLLDQEFYHTDNDNTFNTGTVVFGAGKLFALDAANGLAAYTVVRPAPPAAPPVITDVTQSGGNVVFKLRGTVGKTYLIEKSTQLTPIATWTGDGTVTQNGAEETVTRAIPAGTPRLYFRAREQ